MLSICRKSLTCASTSSAIVGRLLCLSDRLLTIKLSIPARTSIGMPLIKNLRFSKDVEMLLSNEKSHTSERLAWLCQKYLRHESSSLVAALI